MSKVKQRQRGPKLYKEESMEAALEAVQVKQLSLGQAATLYGVPKTTLAGRVKGRRCVVPFSRNVFSPKEEAEIVSWLQTTSTRGCAKTKEELCVNVQRALDAERRQTPFNDNKPSRTWFDAFLARHPSLKYRKPMTPSEHWIGVSEEKLRYWFSEVQESLLKDGVDISQVPPQNIFNCDETGFPLSLPGPCVPVTINQKHPNCTESDNQQQISVLGCCSAEGQVLPPTIVFPGVRWTVRPWEDFSEANFALSPNGYINDDIFLKWLEETFHPVVKDLPRPVVLFVDGHQDRISMKVHAFCQEHRITYYMLPAAASHIIQPLDLVFYESMEKAWRETVTYFETVLQIPSISKQMFSILFRDAWRQTYTTRKMKDAFEASGLSPWNPDSPDYTKCETGLKCGKPVYFRTRNIITSVSEYGTEDSLDSHLRIKKKEPNAVSPSPIPCSPPLTAMSTLTPENGQGTSEYGTEESLDSHLRIKKEEPNVVSPSPIPSSPPLTAVSTLTSENGQGTRLRQCETGNGMDVGLKVDQLIDHVISCGWSLAEMQLVRHRRWRNIQPAPNEGNYRRYLELYDSIVPRSSFDDLPVPKNWYDDDKSQGSRSQAPEYVSGHSSHEFHHKNAQEAKKMRREEKKRRKERAGQKEEKEKKKKNKKKARMDYSEKPAEDQAWQTEPVSINSVEKVRNL